MWIVGWLIEKNITANHFAFRATARVAPTYIYIYLQSGESGFQTIFLYFYYANCHY